MSRVREFHKLDSLNYDPRKVKASVVVKLEWVVYRNNHANQKWDIHMVWMYHSK